MRACVRARHFSLSLSSASLYFFFLSLSLSLSFSLLLFGLPLLFELLDRFPVFVLPFIIIMRLIGWGRGTEETIHKGVN